MIYVDDTTIRQWLEKRAKDEADRVFCIYEDVPITYGEIEEKVNRLANGFLDLGFRRGDRIAIMIPNHQDFFFMVFACAKVGLTYNIFPSIPTSKVPTSTCCCSFQTLVLCSLTKVLRILWRRVWAESV